jgi:hypothetical protein
MMHRSWLLQKAITFLAGVLQADGNTFVYMSSWC